MHRWEKLQFQSEEDMEQLEKDADAYGFYR
jgi:hypothetical protein